MAKFLNVLSAAIIATALGAGFVLVTSSESSAAQSACVKHKGATYVVPGISKKACKGRSKGIHNVGKQKRRNGAHYGVKPGSGWHLVPCGNCNKTGWRYVRVRKVR